MLLGRPDFVARSESAQLASHGPQVPLVRLAVSPGPAAYESNKLLLKRRTGACRMRHSVAFKSWLLSGALPPGVLPKLHKGISVCHRHSGPRTTPALEQLPCASAAGPHTVQDPRNRAASWERAAQRLPQEKIQISWGPGPGPLPTSLPQPQSPLLGP